MKCNYITHQRFLSEKGILLALALAAVLGISSYLPFGYLKKNAQLSEKFNVNGLTHKKSLISIAILGSGPAGLSAAVYGARLGFQTVVFEGPLAGGLLTQTTAVENWPGSISIEGPDIINGLKEQAVKWGVQFVQDTVESVDFTQWPFILMTAEGQTVYALSVILATGASPSKLGIKGELEYWGKGVTTCAVCDAPFFKDQPVVVVGGGDSAVEEAIQLAAYASEITIFVRKDAMRASKAMQDRLKEYPNIKVRYNVEVQEIKGDGQEVKEIVVYDNKAKNSFIMPINGVFLAIGHIPNTAFLNKAVALTEDGHIQVTTRTQETSVKGVFTAGDVADRLYRQAGVAAGHGIAAGMDATFFFKDIGYTHNIEQKLRAAGCLFTTEQAAQYQVTEINNSDEFEALIMEATKPIIVDFYADSCPSCMQMLPAFATVAQEQEQFVTCIKVDADQADAIMKTYHVQKLPTVLAFKDGAIAARFVKPLTKTELTELAQTLK